MRSSNGGKHGLAGWGFRGFPEAGAGLRADDGADFISDAGSPLTAANLRLAKLRSVSEFSGAEGFSLLLGAKARRPAVRCHRRAFQADQARRTARRRWRVPAALSELGRVGRRACAVPGRLAGAWSAQSSAICANLPERDGKGERRWPGKSRRKSRHRGPRPAPPRRKNRRHAKPLADPPRQNISRPRVARRIARPRRGGCRLQNRARGRSNASPSVTIATRISKPMACAPTRTIAISALRRPAMAWRRRMWSG